MTMTGRRFQSLVEQVFNPFLIELGFNPEEPHLSGKYHSASFIRNSHTLIVSFELIDVYLTAMLVRNDDHDLSSIDDPEKTPRLGDLNRKYMSKITPSERADNESFFSAIRVEGQSEKALLKCAKELRLVLPHYLKQNSENF